MTMCGSSESLPHKPVPALAVSLKGFVQSRCIKTSRCKDWIILSERWHLVIFSIIVYRCTWVPVWERLGPRSSAGSVSPLENGPSLIHFLAFYFPWERHSLSDFALVGDCGLSSIIEYSNSSFSFDFYIKTASHFQLLWCLPAWRHRVKYEILTKEIKSLSQIKEEQRFKPGKG